MQQVMEDVKQFRVLEQQKLWLVLQYIVDLNRCRTELIRKVPAKMWWIKHLITL